MYSVAKCIFEDSQAGNQNGWLIEHDVDPYPFFANKYLHFLNVQSTSTNREYAYKLCKFFNYLETIKQKDYVHATQEDLISFLNYIAYGGEKILENDTFLVLGTTISLYATVISGFYSYLYKIGASFDLSYHLKKAGSNKYSFMYGQNWNDEHVQFFIDSANKKAKKKRKHIKWYSDDQLTAVLDGMNTYRDKAVFSFTCDGMRIDEALSIILSEYDSSKGIVVCNRSKGRETGDTGRVVRLSNRSIQLVEEYLYNERSVVEEYQINNKIIPSQYLFINLKQNASFGQPLKYRNYLQILKKAAEHAGLDPANIRTHSGRSTKAMELFRVQSNDPSSLSDQQIADMMGWSNISSAKPYKNARDEETTLANWERLNNAKENRNRNQ